MMCGTVEIQVLERRRTMVVCQNSSKKSLFDVLVRLCWRFLWDNLLIRPESC